MGRVLIVDDDVHVLEALSAALQARGHEVSTAEDAASAMKQVGSGQDAVVLDIWLGADSGFDIFQDMRKTHPDLPLVVMSGGGPGRSLEQAVAMADALGAMKVLIKPFANQDLYDALANYGV